MTLDEMSQRSHSHAPSRPHRLVPRARAQGVPSFIGFHACLFSLLRQLCKRDVNLGDFPGKVANHDADGKIESDHVCNAMRVSETLMSSLGSNLSQRLRKNTHTHTLTADAILRNSCNVVQPHQQKLDRHELDAEARFLSGKR